MKASVSLLALVVAAAASPLNTRQDDGDIAPENSGNGPQGGGENDPKDGGANDSPEETSSDPLKTKEGLCGGWDLTTAEGVDRVWEETFVGATIDSFIRIENHGSKRWVTNLEASVRRGSSGKSGAPGCSHIGTECDPMDGETCDQHFDKYGGSVFDGVTYWAFQAVKGMHAKFNELNRRLTKATLINDLKVTEIINDFGGGDDGTSSTFATISAAFTMANGMAVAVPGVGTALSAGFGVLGGLFAAFAANGKQPVDPGSIAVSLGHNFEQATGVLETTLKVATGGGTPEEEDKLPAPKWDTYESKIAKFFNGGWFLLDDDAGVVNAIFDTVEDNIKRKVANDVMKATSLHLGIDERVKSKEDCTGTGRRWMEVGPDSHCLHIFEQISNIVWSEAKEDVYEKMKKYGLDALEKYYGAVLDCGRNGGDDKEVDTGNMAVGQVPTCFFNLPVAVITTRHCGGGGSPFDTGCGDTTGDAWNP